MITDRLQTYQTSLVDVDVENDLLDSPLLRYKPSAYTTFRIPQALSGRIDLISYYHYNDVNLWWLIARVNLMINVQDDTASGNVIIIPDVMEYYAFYKKNVSPSEDSGLKSPLRSL